MDFPVKAFPHLTALEMGKEIEYPEPVLGKVAGQIPDWVKGSWYRNGPGVLHFKKQSVTHWFDGMALVRKFSIENGNATYISRLIEGDSLLKNLKAGRIAVAEFGTKVQTEDQGLLNKIKTLLTLPELTDNCLINFIVIGDHIFAITESNYIRKIHADTLITQEKVDLAQYLPINVMGSHPLVDKSDGSVFLFSSSIFSKGRTKYNLLKIPKISSGDHYESALSKSKLIGSLDSSWRVSPSYNHSFSITKNFAVFIEMPLKLDIPKMSVAHIRNMTYSDCIEFLPDTQTQIFLIEKETGNKHPFVYKTDPFIAYHHINAYEENGHVVLDVCAYNNNGFFDKYLLENLQLNPDKFAEKFSLKDAGVRVIRIILPLTDNYDRKEENLITLPKTSCKAELSKDGKTIYCKYEEILKGAECPSINSNFIGKKYKYFYSNGGLLLPPGEKLMKIDLEEKACCLTWQEKGCWLSQPVFLQKPEAEDEDDGVLLSAVTCENSSSFLLFLDALTFHELARVHFDANIPPDLHGVFVTYE